MLLMGALPQVEPTAATGVYGLSGGMGMLVAVLLVLAFMGRI